MNLSLVRLLAMFLAGSVATAAEDATVEIHAMDIMHRVSRYLTGACIEDVNHEIYGGIYSQMIFGESFQEPAPSPVLKGFTAFSGEWFPNSGELRASAGDGPKLVSTSPGYGEGEAGVEILFSERKEGNAGLIVKVSGAGKGADAFTGYEISLETSGRLVLGRHRQNWEPITNVVCDVPIGQWIPVLVRSASNTLEVEIAGKRILRFADGVHPLPEGQVGLRTWQRGAQFRNFWYKHDGIAHRLSFEMETNNWVGSVSGMWRPIRVGTAQGEFSLDTDDPFIGAHSQRVSFISGTGETGIENQGLNRWGLNLSAGEVYQGYVWLKASKPTEAFVALENRQGNQVYAETRLLAPGPGWHRVEFKLTPATNDISGRFAIKLKSPGTILVGYAFLQPGDWGRFKGLPVRKDVVDALIAQGITVLRYGGSMINHPEYRWKKMIGPRDRRPPYRGTWYPHSSNGWGIPDFLDLCEAAGFLGIPDFNMDETAQDMADFIQYANAPADTEWGRKRAADGHQKAYALKYLELGNEERVDEVYWRKFEKLAPAIWAKDPNLIIIVGDFQYEQPIHDPYDFRGAASGIRTLAAHEKILALAKAHNREVWFDVHLNTEGPNRSSSVRSLPAFIDALGRVSNGARHQVVVFELNAGNHQHKRALANAVAIMDAEKLNLAVVTSANCLQPDGQNDNGWDQGLLFLNPSNVWLQPPGYITKMLSINYQPLLVRSTVVSPGKELDVAALRSEDGKTLVLEIVNQHDQPTITSIQLEGFTPSLNTALVEELAGSLTDMNTAGESSRLTPSKTQWRHGFKDGRASYTLRPHSFTVLRLQ